MDLRQLLQQQKLQGKTLGIEWQAYGLTAASGRQVESALDGFCRLQDASRLVSELRVIKSEAEIVFVRRAAELADDALEAAVVETRCGAYEGDILAAMHNAIFRGGGDYPGNEFIIGSGKNALLCRYYSGRRHLSPQDQLTLEFAGVYRHYHACLMRTLVVGVVSAIEWQMYAACEQALTACMLSVKPGNCMGDVFDTHARVMDDLGYRKHRLDACGYSLGTTFTPTWMDWPMFHTGNEQVIRPGMVCFLHMILADSDRQLAMTLGQTVLVTESGCESLHRCSPELICKT
jgi:Xaa-Pro dipeptidase